MKVALNVKTPTNSEPDILAFCGGLGLPGVVDYKPTVKFIKMVDTGFDLLNSCNKDKISQASKGKKITICNKKMFIDSMNFKLSDGIYLLGRKTGLCEFVIGLLSLRDLEQYVWNDSPILKFILTSR